MGLILLNQNTMVWGEIIGFKGFLLTEQLHLHTERPVPGKRADTSHADVGARPEGLVHGPHPHGWNGDAVLFYCSFWAEGGKVLRSKHRANTMTNTAFVDAPVSNG